MTEPLSMDEAFIGKLTEIVLANLTNENFNVEKLAREAGISRITLYRRVRSIKQQDISQFIRGVRLQRAMEMLQNHEGSVVDIAFKTGFGSPTYFNKCFHDYYGFPPGEIRKNVNAESQNKLTDKHYRESVPYKDLKSKPDVKSLSKRIKYKKLLITSFGILSALLVVYLLYILVIKDSVIRPGAKRPEKSIVVLPFKNLSDDPENQYFADGIMEDILNCLFRISEMRVVSRTTSEHFRESRLTSPEIGKELNVNYVLEGSVQRQDKEVRIFVQLINVRDDQHLISEKYEGEMTDIFAFQSDIAKKVANALEAVLSGPEIGHIEKPVTTNPEAYDYYLKARFLLHKSNDVQRLDISKQGLTASIPYYEKAIAADSSFAEAYAGLANAWFNLCAWGWYKPYYEGLQKALYFSNKALKIDPDCAEAHAVKGIYLIYPEFKLGEARRELQISIQLNPNFAAAHQWYAQLLMITGPIEEAREQIDRALELEPYFWVLHDLNSWIYYFEEKYQDGIDASFAGLDLNPNSSDNNWLFVLHYVKLGEGEKAAKALHDNFDRYQVTRIYSDEILDAFNESGIKGMFTWLIDFNINRPIPLEGLSGHPYYIAWWYAILGNREQSIYWFERAIEAETRPLHYFNLIANNPDFDILRNDPRFLAVIEKTGLAPYHKRKAR